MLKSLFLVTCLICLLVFCNEEKRDQIAPSIKIELPAENSSYIVTEGVPIKAEVSDNMNITSIRVSLNSSTIPNKVIEAISYQPNTKYFSLSFNFQIRDSLIESGYYYLQIDASDGENISRAFRTVVLGGIPKKTVSIIVGCQNSSQTQYYNLDSSMQFQSIYSRNGELLKVVINSYDQVMWSVFANSNEVQAFHLVDNRIVYTYQAPNSGFTQVYTDLTRFDRSIYTANKQVGIERFNAQFLRTILVQSSGNNVVSNLAVNKEYMISTEQVGPNQNNFIARYENSGAAIASYPILGQAKALFFTGDYEALLFCEAPNQLLIYKYSIGTASFNQSSLIHSDSISDILQIAANEFIFSTSAGLKRFSNSGNTMSTFASNYRMGALAFDEINDQVLLSQGKDLIRLNVNTGNQIGAAIQFPKKIKTIAVRYNR